MRVRGFEAGVFGVVVFEEIVDGFFEEIFGRLVEDVVVFVVFAGDI